MRLHHAGYGLREEQRNVVDGRIGDQIDGNYGVVLGVHCPPVRVAGGSQPAPDIRGDQDITPDDDAE